MGRGLRGVLIGLEPGVPAPVRGLLRVPRREERRPRRIRRRLVPLRNPGVRLQRVRVLPARGVSLDPGAGAARRITASSACAPWWWIPISWGPRTSRRSARAPSTSIIASGSGPGPRRCCAFSEEELRRSRSDRRTGRRCRCSGASRGRRLPHPAGRQPRAGAPRAGARSRRPGDAGHRPPSRGDREAATREAVRRVARALGVPDAGRHGPRPSGSAFQQLGPRDGARPGSRPLAALEPRAPRSHDPREGRPGGRALRAPAFSATPASAGASRRWSLGRRPRDARSHPRADPPLRRAARSGAWPGRRRR